MLVDDSKEFVETMRTMLEANGFDVDVAYSGEQARTKAAQDPPDVFILDVMMETKTAGFETARWLRQQPNTREVPIIMLTAVNQEFPFEFGPDEVWLPVDVFLEKPVNPRRLLSEVQKATS